MLKHYLSNIFTDWKFCWPDPDLTFQIIKIINWSCLPKILYNLFLQ
jgi:hypothetical protein